MPIYGGSTQRNQVYVGPNLLESVYVGTQMVWEAEQWLFTDNFNRTSIGSNWSSSGGILLNGGMLQKNDNAGSADNWTVQTFPSDNLQVRCVLGTVPDPVQVSSIVLGSPSQYVYCEFSPNGGQIGDYNGSSWSTRATVGSVPWVAGDVIEVRRLVNTVQMLRNGSVILSATSSVARGASYRRVNLSVRTHASGIWRYKSPFFDDVKIRTYVP